MARISRGGKHVAYTEECLGAGRRLGRPDFMVCPRRQSDAGSDPSGTDQLELLRRDTRLRSSPLAATRVLETGRPHAEKGDSESFLAPMPARHLVFSSVASRVSSRL